MNLFEIDDILIERKLLKAPFGYSGGKQFLAKRLLPLIPYKNGYIEPFGGGANILLARRESPLEVYNDAYGGVVDFYRCIKNAKLFDELLDKIELEIHSREQFQDYLETLKETSNIVDRAIKWYYLTVFSFNGLRRNFGRSTTGRNSMINKIQGKIPLFHEIHTRLLKVTIENMDYSFIIRDYDNKDTVFYCDPPYLNTDKGSSPVSFKYDDHMNLLEQIFDSKGYFVVSNYKNELYESFNWDEKYYFDAPERALSKGTTEGNNKTFEMERGVITEAVYVKKG